MKHVIFAALAITASSAAFLHDVAKEEEWISFKVRFENSLPITKRRILLITRLIRSLHMPFAIITGENKKYFVFSFISSKITNSKNKFPADKCNIKMIHILIQCSELT